MDSYMYAIKKRFLISLCILAIWGASHAMANDSKIIGDWKIVKGKFEEQEYCYAYSTPYRTKAFEGEFRNIPYLFITYKGNKKLSFGVNSGYVINKEKGFTLKVNDRVHLLDVKLNENAWTYTEVQDVAIMNDMIEGTGSVEVRSYDTKDDSAVDFYSLKGLPHVVKHLSTSCREIQQSSK